MDLRKKEWWILGTCTKSTTDSWIYKKKYDKYLGLGQKVGCRKKYNKYLKVEQKVGQKLKTSVKSITYTLKLDFKSHLPSEHPSQTPSSKPTFPVGLWSYEKSWDLVQRGLPA